MPVTRKEVEHIAKLARLSFSDEAKERLTHELNLILAHMEKLNELDTSNVAPLSHVADPTPAAGATMREDEVHPSLTTAEALKNAPDSNGKFFKVPKVIG